MEIVESLAPGKAMLQIHVIKPFEARNTVEFNARRILDRKELLRCSAVVVFSLRLCREIGARPCSQQRRVVAGNGIGSQLSGEVLRQCQRCGMSLAE
jgi:hypothetical protein